MNMEQNFRLFSENIRSAKDDKERTRGVQFGYKLNGYWYAHTFPISQAINHKNFTGPDMCEDCYENGFTNDLFTNYCDDCAKMYDKIEKKKVSDYISSLQSQPVKKEKNKTDKIAEVVDLTKNKCDTDNNYFIDLRD